MRLKSDICGINHFIRIRSRNYEQYRNSVAQNISWNTWRNLVCTFKSTSTGITAVCIYRLHGLLIHVRKVCELSALNEYARNLVWKMYRPIIRMIKPILFIFGLFNGIGSIPGCRKSKILRLKILDFCDITPCPSVNILRCFGET